MPEQPPAELLLHATAIAVAGNAMLFRGPSGSGKSDLALRCLAQAPGPLVQNGAAVLISDDQCHVTKTNTDQLIVSAPEPLKGLIEVRGVGICRVPHDAQARVRLLVDLTTETPERLPPEPMETETLLGIAVPRTQLCPHYPSSAIKALLLLAAVTCRS
ncbi:MAG: hypothetical protein AAF732_10180 [Pseudomonadota bacterium]